MPELHERHENLWVLVYAPALWAAHFLLSYVTAAIWCARVVGRDGSLGTVQVLVGLYTLVALIGIGLTARRALRRHQYGDSSLPHDEDTPEDRYRFLGWATLLLSGLSAVATIYVAVVVLFVDTCH